MTNLTIQEFYADRSVFITGATGRLYLLIRPTSPEKDASFRLKELLKCEVFEWLRQNQPEALKKLISISGDVSMIGLGIASSDMQELEENVSVVFHSAARVKFDDDLRSAIDSNVKGPDTMTKFCRRLKHLKVFLHVSTTFNNLDKKEIEEEIYPATLDPKKLVDLVDSMDDHLLASITKQLVGKCPNVYAYTKALGEQLLQNECKLHKLPLVVVRPSTVTAALNEPSPGWIDNLNGPSGIVAGISKGIIRTVKCNSQLVTDLIPVDIPINLMIVAAWDKASNDSSIETIRVYNCSSGSLNPVTWGQFKVFGMNAVRKFPCKEIMWYPSITFNTNELVFQLQIAFYHRLPAFLIDTIAQLCGKKAFLSRLYAKAHKAMSCLEFYTMREWKFVSRNSDQLMEKMSAQDKTTFNFDVRQIDWESYLDSYVFGIQKHLLKDDSSSLPSARNNLKKMKRIRVLAYLIITALMMFFFYALVTMGSSFIFADRLTIDISSNNTTDELNILNGTQSQEFPVLLDVDTCMS